MAAAALDGGAAADRSFPKRQFKKAHRLKSSGDFSQVFKCRLSVADGTLVVYGRPIRDPKQGRLGLSVSRKVGNAVVRNRWKRLIREAYRNLGDEKLGWELIAIPCKGGECSFRAISRSLSNNLRRLAKKRVKQSGSGKHSSKP